MVRNPRERNSSYWQCQELDEVAFHFCCEDCTKKKAMSPAGPELSLWSLRVRSRTSIDEFLV